MSYLRYYRIIALLIILIVFFISACNKHDSSSEAPPPFSAKLQKATDSHDMEQRLKSELTRWYLRMHARSMYGGPMMSGIDVAGQPGTTSPVSADSPVDTSHSDTNVQEIGVDEGDLVKTDGTYIYMARGSHFFVLLANPADQSALVSDIDLHDFINEIHLTGTHATVITTRYQSTVSSTATLTGYAPFRMFTKVYCYDVSAPTSPKMTATFDVPGYAQGTRRINDTLYLVTNFTIDLPVAATPWDYLTTVNYDSGSYNAASEKALEENLARIDDMTLDELLPTMTKIVFDNGVAGEVATGPAVSFSNIFIPEFGNGIDLSLVSSITLSGPNPSVAGTTAVLSSWGGIYMSLDNLYLVSDNNWFWIEPVAGMSMPQSNPEPRTAVHKFSVAGTSGPVLYRGSGMVDGWLNNRFSMSDYQGYLHIGTTRGGWWGEGISNQLAILAEKDGQLEETGKITGLAQGERIYSMRFDRNRGYMVTFKQTDPLFTLDLNDPANPRVAGEIEVTGFATYIHLIGTDSKRLLTIGRSADQNGRITGNKLQLFDVSDLAAPSPLASYDLGSGWSDALYDPHAFLYYEPMGILTIPYYAYGPTFDTYSSGLDVFSIGPAVINKKGTIVSKTTATGYGAYLDTVDRAVIIGNAIYAIAHRSVTAADATDLRILKSVVLPESYPYGFIGGGIVGGGGGTVGPGMPMGTGLSAFHRTILE